VPSIDLGFRSPEVQPESSRVCGRGQQLYAARVVRDLIIVLFGMRKGKEMNEFVPRPSRILATLFSWSFGSKYRFGFDYLH
jgi:hypothetical protein